ncbi:MAG: efflux transporter outer membrane subunit [bacterium]
MGLAAGCSMAPEYIRPKAPVPSSWPQGGPYQMAQQQEDTPSLDIKWQEFITDHKLKEIIHMALANNRDLRISALNVERARALYGIQRAELFPSLHASATGSKQRIPADLSGAGKALTVEQYSVSLGITSWEVDFFGRIRSLKDKALEDYLATEQARKSVQILLISEVFNTYLAIAAIQDNLELARATLDVQEGVHLIISKRHQLGLASELDLRRAQTQVEAARGDISRYTRELLQQQNSLNLLVGSQVPQELLPKGLAHVSPPRAISAGVSSEVLLSRPDILAAEAQLRAANASIGAARASLFPRISLTTALGSASAELTGLFKAGSGGWSYIPQLVMPIFDARLWSALEASKVQKEIALAQYEKAIQTAFREVADSLAQGSTLREQLKAQQALVEATQRTYDLANLRYMQGLDSYLSVLDAQRSMYAAQQGLVNLKLALLANRVRLYAVLGGGGENEKPHS